MYKNLILSGGATKGFCYIGVLKSLEEKSLLKYIKNFQGTSVGAVFATLFAMGFTSTELLEYLSEDIDYTNGITIDNFLDSYGFYDGSAIITVIEKIISRKYDKDITFRQLKNIQHTTLIICVTNLNQHRIEYLSYKKYPKMKIIDAIRYAITIPFIFNVKQYNNLLYIDAAVINNISLKKYDPKDTIAFIIKDKIDSSKNNRIDSIESYIKNIFRCMSKNHFNKIKKRKKKYNLLELNFSNINTLNFALTEQERNYLYNDGYTKSNIFLTKLLGRLKNK